VRVCSVGHRRFAGIAGRYAATLRTPFGIGRGTPLPVAADSSPCGSPCSPCYLAPVTPAQHNATSNVFCRVTVAALPHPVSNPFRLVPGHGPTRCLA
jgi:hypothetical protein